MGRLVDSTGTYAYHGRSADYREHRVIEPGRKVIRLETFTKNPFGIVKVSTDDGVEGWGQVSTFDADLSAAVLHRKLAPRVLGKDPADIDALVDRCIEANYKFPWSFVCRALAGIDTAIWDLYGKIRGMPVYQLLGGTNAIVPAYGSSMRRDIKPVDEGERLARLRDSHGFGAFKVRAGIENGHDGDAWPGRTEELIPAVRRAVGEGVRLLIDGNSCYTPARAIEVGRLLEQHGFDHFEEPCPYWELEWTAKVAAALDIAVAGGEQDNDLAQWRRMIATNAVDIVQPDVCYIGGVTRALRVALMAEQAGKPVVPHSANLSLVTLFTAHLMSALPNAGPHLEFTIEWESGMNQQAREIYSPLPQVQDGCVMLPAAPGWGVEIHADWLRDAEYQKSE